MKKYIQLLISILICSSAISQGIHFEKGQLNEVLALAKKENKLVFVDVYTTWCGPCKQMSKNIFPLDEVGDYYNAHFISYKLDAEDAKFNGPELAKQYKIQGYPCYLFLDGDGKVVSRSGGSMPAETFIKVARAAMGEDINADYKKAIEAFEAGEYNDDVLYVLLAQFGVYSSGLSSREASAKAYERYNKAGSQYLQRAPEKFANTKDLKLLSDIYHQAGVRRGHPLVEYLVSNYASIAKQVDEKTLGQLLMYINYSSIDESAYNGHLDEYKGYLRDISGSLKAAYAFNDEDELPAVPFLTAKGDMEYAIGQKDYDTFIEKYEDFLSFNKQPGTIDYLMPARRILDQGNGTPSIEQLKKCTPFNQIAYDKYKNAYVCTDFGLLMAKLGETEKAKAYYLEAFELFKEQGERGQKAIERYQQEMRELGL